MPQLPPDTLLRQWQMLRMIPRHPLKITARELHARLQSEQFDVTKRTVERDLLALSELFPLVSDERDKPYGWSWAKDAPTFSLPGLSHNEALTLVMVEQHLNTLLPTSTLEQLTPYFKAARQHLSGIPQAERTRSWLNKVRTVPPTQPLLPPVIKPAVQQIVHEALLADRQLDIKYLKLGQSEAVEYRIHPLAIIQRGLIVYLYCRFFDYEDGRLIALHRIQAATVREEKTNIPSHFSIDEIIGSGALGFGEGKLIKLDALFSREVGEHMQETPLSVDQVATPQEDGKLRITATVTDTPQLVWWLLSLGDSVEVVRPKALRQSIAKTAGRMCANYQG